VVALKYRLDEMLDFGDHFASNRINRGWTLAGVGEFFLEFFSRKNELSIAGATGAQWNGAILLRVLLTCRLL
jgi:hypothetical protein